MLEAEDGPAAIELFQWTPALDMLITDVGLTNGINGRQLADIIRATSPALPVLFITGYAGAARLDELDAGMKILSAAVILRAASACSARSFLPPKLQSPWWWIHRKRRHQ